MPEQESIHQETIETPDIVIPTEVFPGDAQKTGGMPDNLSPVGRNQTPEDSKRVRATEARLRAALRDPEGPVAAGMKMHTKLR